MEIFDVLTELGSNMTRLVRIYLQRGLARDNVLILRRIVTTQGCKLGLTSSAHCRRRLELSNPRSAIALKRGLFALKRSSCKLKRGLVTLQSALCDRQILVELVLER